MPEAVIVAAARSPIGRANKGALAGVRPDDLAAAMVRAALDQIPSLERHEIDDLILGCAQPGGEAGYNLARVTAVLAGLQDVPGVTVNRYCSSSLQTTRMAYHAIRAGEGDVFVSAGVETVSRYRLGSTDFLPETMNPRFEVAQERTAELAATNETWVDGRTAEAMPDIYISMGQTAENVATSLGIARREQDEFAVRSQNRAEAAIANGFFQREISPYTLADGTTVSTDDGPRPGVNYEAVASLRPVFRPGGTVTAGNCCPLNDGAAAVVVMSETKAKSLGITPLARIIASGLSGLSPEIMGMGPVEATRQALARARMVISDIDLVEINEAFAVQVIGSARELKIRDDQLNINGGAIALGHPFGMSGARITTTLLSSLQFHNKSVGLGTMCVGGGQGMAMIFERLS